MLFGGLPLQDGIKTGGNAVGDNIKQERTKVYLSSEKAYIEFAKKFIEEGFSVHVGKDRDVARNRNKFYFEYWKEG